MEEILRDQIWQFVGVVLALIAIIISIVLYLKQKTKKELSYKIVNWSSILSLKEQDQGDIKLLYKDHVVKNADLIICKIANTGNVSITAEDFKKPIKIEFGKDSQILNAEIIETTPQGLEIQLQTDEEKSLIEKLLLNKGDSFTINYLVSECKDKDISIHSRIVGIPKIIEARDKKNSILVYLVSNILVFVGFLGAGITSNYTWLILAAISYITMIISMKSLPMKDET
jgi:hypothetical protein